jgi:pyruvate dehydrogenase E1 component
MAAAELLGEDFGVAADVWSVPSFTEVRREALVVERRNRLRPGAARERSWVEECFAGTEGPFVAATDYMRSVADQVRTWVPRRYVTLGTDGFGRSDTRTRLRSFFEVDRHSVVLAALAALAADDEVPESAPSRAIEKYGLDADKPAPWTV